MAKFYKSRIVFQDGGFNFDGRTVRTLSSAQAEMYWDTEQQLFTVKSLKTGAVEECFPNTVKQCTPLAVAVAVPAKGKSAA